MGAKRVSIGAMKKSIYCKEDVCIGCRLCEIWCLVEHSESKDIVKAFNYEKERAIARVMVEERKPVSFALQCRHCDEPDCVYACISGALYRENGVVLHDASKCVGCWSCVMACSRGAIFRDEIHDKAVKCDLCNGREQPICVENCPNEALILMSEGEKQNEI